MTYPNILRRYLGTLLDVFVLWCLVYGFSRLIVLTGSDSTVIYWVLGISLLLYEPVLTTYACTLGQFLMRIRIRTVDSLQRINLAQATIRMVVKYVLGGISALVIPVSKHRRAIHDLTADTIVVEATSIEPAPNFST